MYGSTKSKPGGHCPLLLKRRDVVRIKCFVLGFIMSIVMISALNVFAGDILNVVRVNYQIFIDDTELDMGQKTPILNFDGSTYLPLRSITNALGSRIEWINGKVKIYPKTKEVTKEVIRDVPRDVIKEVIKEVPKYMPPVTVINFDNGDKYEGTIIGNKKEGFGKYTWTNGDYYVGEWKNNEITGKGMYCYSNGDIYAGEFVGAKHISGIFNNRYAQANSNTGVSHNTSTSSSIPKPIINTEKQINSLDVYKVALEKLDFTRSHLIDYVTRTYNTKLQELRDDANDRGMYNSSYRTDKETELKTKYDNDIVKINTAYQTDLKALKLKYGVE
jgi:hypothetical protein